MKIVTKSGDEGYTFFGKRKVKKSSLLIEAIGSLDELNSCIGVVRSFIKDKEIDEILKNIQKDLFMIGYSIYSKKYKFGREKIEWIEREIESFEKRIPELKGFILPSGSKETSLLHFSRSVARRAERNIVKIKEREKIKGEVIIYLNRLSDLLFLMARYLNKEKEENV